MNGARAASAMPVVVGPCAGVTLPVNDVDDAVVVLHPPKARAVSTPTASAHRDAAAIRS